MDANEEKLFIAILTGAILVSLLLIFFLVLFVVHHKRSEQRYVGKLTAGVATLEAERRRIANDIHDDLGPTLSLIKVLAASIVNTSPEDKAVVGEMNERIDEVIYKIKATSHNLLPAVLERQSLFAAVQAHAEVVNRVNTLQVETDFFYENEYLPKDKEVHVYRIIQEVINNAIKHSQASRLLIRMDENDREMVIVMSDDGIGFNYDEMNRSSFGYGIPNILSRVEILGGDLYIDTAPGKGVKYEMRIKINSNGE